MSTVYVFGAGASYAEELHLARPTSRLQAPPLAKDFFDGVRLDALDYSKAEEDLADVVEYVRRTMLVKDEFGKGAWKSLDLEQVFTSLETEREFHNPESDDGARLLLTRNQLVRYIRRIVSYCTHWTSGRYYRAVVRSLRPDDSVITFNWDLLTDKEFHANHSLVGQYSNFFRTVPMAPTSILFPEMVGTGAFLKLHGSLNWFRCGNLKCQANAKVRYLFDIEESWKVNSEGVDVPCQDCGSVMTPIIVPPLLRKPITEDPVIRSAWGLARARLLSATKVVVAGFSAAPTDFSRMPVSS